MADRPPSPGVTAFYLEYAWDCNVRTEILINTQSTQSDLNTIQFYTQTQDQENKGLDLRRIEEKSLIYNTSFLDEYEYSYIALDRGRRKVEDEIGSLETRLNNVSDKEIYREKKDFRERKEFQKYVQSGMRICKE
ncbi:hypothetical protein Tco_1083462 [Tanacetum coccineum]